MGDKGQPRVALAHDYLTQRGGAERVVLAMAGAFPGAPIHTSIYDPAGTFPEFAGHDVRPITALDRNPLFRRDHRLAFPVLARAFERTRVDADVVVCSSSGWAHGISAAGRKVVYCHNPPRWLHQTGRFLETEKGLARVAQRSLRPYLLRWDQRAAQSADRYLANSTIVRERIRDAYGIDAEVLHPPHGADPDGDQEPVAGVEPGFFLAVSRLLLYKNVHVLAEAFAGLPDQRLVVVGHGPMRHEVDMRSRGNVTVLGRLPDSQLRWLYANCRGLVSASYEDFGLTPVEGYAFGKPAVLLRYGGFLDSTVEGLTGVLFDQPAPAAMRSAVRRCLETDWDPAAIRAHAERFSTAVFQQRIVEVVEEIVRS